LEQHSPEKRPVNLIQTIERVSLILDRVGQNPQGVSIKELSSGLNLPKGTIHRILSSLSYFGYIRQDAVTKNYSLGLKLIELGSLLFGQLDLRRVAEPILRELAETTGETAYMVVLDGSEVVYIEKIESLQLTGGLKMASKVGSRNPLHSCAVGKTLLSFFPEQELDRLIRKKGLTRRTVNTITEPERLKEQLRVVRAQGYAVDDEENEEGIRCLAAPVFDEKGRPVAAISVSGPAVRVTKKIIQDVFRKEVMKAASEISRRLGFNGRVENG
jgi:DNA-binding IclR family transcriptional regulator